MTRNIDNNDDEGGIPDDELLPLVNDEAPTAQSAAPPSASPLRPMAPTAAASSNGTSQYQPLPTLADATNFLRIKLPLPRIVSAIGRVIQGEGFRLLIPAVCLPTIEEQEELAELGGSADNEREASISSKDNVPFVLLSIAIPSLT